jgi:hypothetical protein
MEALGRRVRDSDTFMARITADRIVRHLERSSYVILKKPPIPGAAATIRGEPGLPTASDGTRLNPLRFGVLAQVCPVGLFTCSNLRSPCGGAVSPK